MIDDVLSLFTDGMRLLEEKSKLLQQIKTNPELILTDLYNPKDRFPHASFPYNLFSEDRFSNLGELSLSSFQQYLFETIKDYVQNKDTVVSLRMSDEYRCPADFVMFLGKWEVLRFNIYDHSLLCSKENLLEDLDDKVIFWQKKLDTSENHLRHWEDYQDNPDHMCKNLKQKLAFNLRKSFFLDKIDEKVDYYRGLAKIEQEFMSHAVDLRVDYILNQSSIKRERELWQDLFQAQFKYKLIIDEI